MCLSRVTSQCHTIPWSHQLLPHLCWFVKIYNSPVFYSIFYVLLFLAPVLCSAVQCFSSFGKMFGCWLHNNTSFRTLMQIFQRQAPDKKIMLMFRSWSSNEITGLFKHPQLPFHNFYEADSYWGFNLDLVCLELIVSTPHGPPPPDLIIVITTLLPRPRHWPPNIFSHETCSHIWDQRRDAGAGAGGEIG